MRVNRLFVLFVVFVLAVSWYASSGAEAAAASGGGNAAAAAAAAVRRANPKRSRTLAPAAGGVNPTTTTTTTTTTKGKGAGKIVPVSKLSPAQFRSRLKSKRSDPLILFNKRSAPSAVNLKTGLKKRHARGKAASAAKLLGTFANDVSGKSQTVQAKSRKGQKGTKTPKTASAKKVRFASLRDPTGAGRNGGQSGKTGGQSGKTGGQSGKTGGQSGKTGGQSGKTGGQSGKTGGSAGGDVLTAPPVAPASNIPVNGIDPKGILVLGNIEGRTDPNDPVVVFFRNQGDGAGCWAIAAVTIYEIYLQMKGASFAKQTIRAPIAVDQVIKCVKNDGPMGGNPVTALTWLFTHQAIMERDYRRGTPLTCPPSSPSKPDFGVWDNPCTKGDCSGQSKNEMAMAQSMFSKAGNVQTMYFVYVDASQWQSYQKPDWPSNLADPANLADYVFPTKKCSNDPMKGDHIVVIETVVEDPKTQKLYWKILNSWGTTWGAAGFIYLEFGVNACGLANYVSVISSEK